MNIYYLDRRDRNFLAHCATTSCRTCETFEAMKQLRMSKPLKSALAQASEVSEGAMGNYASGVLMSDLLYYSFSAVFGAEEAETVFGGESECAELFAYGALTGHYSESGEGLTIADIL